MYNKSSIIPCDHLLKKKKRFHMKTDKQNTACAATVWCTVKFYMLTFGFIDPPKENTTRYTIIWEVHKQLLFFRLEPHHEHSVQMQLTGSWQGPQKQTEEPWESVTVGYEAVGLCWQDERCSKLQDVRAFLLYNGCVEGDGACSIIQASDHSVQD